MLDMLSLGIHNAILRMFVKHSCIPVFNKADYAQLSRIKKPL